MFRTIVFIILTCLLLSASAGAGIERRMGGGGTGFPFDITEEEPPECVDDGNNSAIDADTIENSTYVLEVVCAEDPFDFYTFTLPTGADTEGYILFIGTGPGTVVRLADASGVLFEEATTEDNDSIAIPVSVAASVGGTYSMRVSYYSSYDTDHVYILGLLLEYSGCYAEGNESHTGATSIDFGDRIEDVLCESDTSDWYRFDPSPDELDDGWVQLDSMGVTMRLIIARAGGTELHAQMVSSDAAKVNFADVPGMAMAITYYAAVEILDVTPGEEYEYKLRLGRGDISDLPTMSMGMVHVLPPIPAWPCPNMINTAPRGRRFAVWEVYTRRRVTTSVEAKYM